MRSIETCRECKRYNGSHLLTCQTFARQAAAAIHMTRGSRKPKAKAGAR